MPSVWGPGKRRAEGMERAARARGGRAAGRGRVTARRQNAPAATAGAARGDLGEPHQLRQLGDVGGNAPGLVAGEEMWAIEAWSVLPRSSAVALTRLAPSLPQER
jgi:hypothetical protein